jgi:hypothetical protein
MNSLPGTVDVNGRVWVCLRTKESLSWMKPSCCEGRLTTGCLPKLDFELNIPTDKGFDVASNSDFVWAFVD